MRAFLILAAIVLCVRSQSNLRLCTECIGNGIKATIKKDCTIGAVQALKDTLKGHASNVISQYLSESVLPSLNSADVKQGASDTALQACETCVDEIKDYCKGVRNTKCRTCTATASFLPTLEGGAAALAIGALKDRCADVIDGINNAGGSSSGDGGGSPTTPTPPTTPPPPTPVPWCQNNMFCDAKTIEGPTGFRPGLSDSEYKAKCKEYCDNLGCSYYTLTEEISTGYVLCLNYEDVCANAWKSEHKTWKNYKNVVTYGKGDASKCVGTSGAKEMQFSAVVTLLPILLFLV